MSTARDGENVSSTVEHGGDADTSLSSSAASDSESGISTTTLDALPLFFGVVGAAAFVLGLADDAFCEALRFVGAGVSEAVFLGRPGRLFGDSVGCADGGGSCGSSALATEDCVRIGVLVGDAAVAALPLGIDAADESVDACR